MPPRRSVRSKTSAHPPSRSPSPEAQRARSRASATTKRKRDVPAEVDENDQSVLDIDTPAETSTRRSSRARSKPPSQEASKRSTRTKETIKPSNSIETIEEEQDVPSPPKRVKKNAEDKVEVEVEEDESEEEIVARPARRASRKLNSSTVDTRRAAPSKPSRRKLVIEEEEDSPNSGVEVEANADPEDSDKFQTIKNQTSLDTSSSSLSSADTEERNEDISGNIEPADVEKSLLESPPPTTREPELEKEEPSGPKSRLVIHKLVLVNFKSYAGRQEIGPFHKSFSAIVGPNGSGKSNTIDALLFVFGYRATKMRQAKLSELIHNSANYPDLEECSVEIHFREILDLPGPDAYEVIPNSQLSVARTAYKNNSSKYVINGRSSTYSEVQSLLKDRGIDLDHKRFLILQGEVESIALMKPKAQNEHEDGLLEYLEDIIGTSKYKEPIEEAMTELDKFAEERTEKMNRLRIVEKEKNLLEDKKRDAENFLRLQNEHVKALSRLYQWYLGKFFAVDQELTVTIDALEKELANETERNKDDITHCQMLEDHFQKRGKAYEEVKSAAAEAVKELAVHEKQRVGLEERRKHANGKAKKLKKSIQEDEHARAEAARSIGENAAKSERENVKLRELEAKLAEEEEELDKVRDSLRDKTQVFHDQIEVKQKELQPWTARINAKRSDNDVAISERDTLANKVAAVKAQNDEAQEALSKLRTEMGTKEGELDDARGHKAKLTKEFKSKESTLHDARKRVEDSRSKASAARQKVDEAKQSQAASTSQGKVLDSLTRLRDTGRISGFHGRLGSLGTIPEKYDVAISTASPALHNLVVDTVDQGQSCIEYLRKQNIGRASFMVLEKLSSTNGLDKVSTPENVPRLFDLIKPKEARFAPAFFKAVGNTLVANDLEQANRIAFGAHKRWRVVTLTGQLIDTSGTMSGGGTHVSRGAMSSKLAPDAVQPDTLRRYEKESEESTKAYEAALSDLRRVESEMDSFSREMPQVEMAIQKIELELQNGSKRIAEAEKRLKELKSMSKPDQGDLARISKLEREIEASNRELENLTKETDIIEKAIKDLEKKILEVGGSKLLTQKSKVDGIKLHIGLAQDEIAKADVNKSKAEKDVAKLEKTIESNTSALSEASKELEELEEQISECDQYVTALQSKVDAAQAAADNAKEDLETLKAELDEKTEQIQAFRKKEMEIQQKLNDARKESTENEKAIEHYGKEHDKLSLEEIDDDDDEDEENNDAEAPKDDEGNIVKQEPGEASLPKAKTSSTELHIYTVEELARFKKKELLADVTYLEEQVKNANPNLGVLKEYRKREKEFLDRAKDLEDVTHRRDEQKKKYDGLRKQRLDEFMTGFNTISAKLKEMYQMITLGGNAELELVDSMDPFSEGIIFSVMPPKKSWKNISNLSGGEKTLSSLALVFALHVFKPTPLYFMDEIDAALDFRNVSIVANYIKDRTKNAQFIIISLRNDMFELSHRLIGIYKTSNVTKSVSINNHPLRVKPMNKIAAAA